MAQPPSDPYPIDAARLATALRHRPQRMTRALESLGYQIAGPQSAPVVCDRAWRGVDLGDIVARVLAGHPDVQYEIYQCYMDVTR